MKSRTRDVVTLGCLLAVVVAVSSSSASHNHSLHRRDHHEGRSDPVRQSRTKDTQSVDASVGRVSAARINYISHLEVACQDARRDMDGSYSRLSSDSGHCYILVTKGETFSDARQACAKGGGSLATLTSTGEVNKMGGFYQQEPFIGYYLERQKRTDVWTWVTGEIPILGSGTLYENWARGGKEKEGSCVATNKKGGWVRAHCNHKRAFICELDALELVEVIRPKTYEESVNGNIVTPKTKSRHGIQSPTEKSKKQKLENTNEEEQKMVLHADKHAGHQSAKEMFTKYLNSWVSAYSDIRSHFARRDILSREILNKFFLKPEENGLPRIEIYITLGEQRIRARVFEEMAFIRELIDRLENIYRLRPTITKFIQFVHKDVVEMHANYKASSRGRREIEGILRKLKLRWGKAHADVKSLTGKQAALVKGNAKGVTNIYNIEVEEHKIKPEINKNVDAVKKMTRRMRLLYELAKPSYDALPKIHEQSKKDRLTMQDVKVIMKKLKSEAPGLVKYIKSGIVQRHKLIKGIDSSVRQAAASEDNFQEAVVDHIKSMSGSLAGGFWTSNEKKEAEEMFNKALEDMKLHFLHLKHTILEEIRFWTSKVHDAPDSKSAIGTLVENAAKRVMERLNGKGLGDEEAREKSSEQMFKTPEEKMVDVPKA